MQNDKTQGLQESSTKWKETINRSI